jgi:hypothetical protein
VFVGKGRPGFAEEAGEVAAPEVNGKGLPQEVECRGEIRAGGYFVVAEGAYYNGVGGKGQAAEQLAGAIDPGIEIGLDALFKSEQAKGKGICSGCQWQIRTEVEVGKGCIPAFYFGCQQPHDLNDLGQNYKRSAWRGGFCLVA